MHNHVASYVPESLTAHEFAKAASCLHKMYKYLGLSLLGRISIIQTASCFSSEKTTLASFVFYPDMF
jgi:hypothetical protein